MKRAELPFESMLTRREALAGAVYVVLHFALLPLLFDVLGQSNEWFTVGWVNLLYYGLGVVFLGAFMLNWLYRQYERLLDNSILCLGSIAGGYLLDYILSGMLVLLLTWFEIEVGETPNDSAILELSGFDLRAVKAVSLFLAPVLEETLMRGVIFGTLRQRNRESAYVVSVLLFAYCHVWMYAPEGAAFWLALVQYIPVSIALCRTYERCGSIWAPIALHMFINAMGFGLMGI